MDRRQFPSEYRGQGGIYIYTVTYQFPDTKAIYPL